MTENVQNLSLDQFDPTVQQLNEMVAAAQAIDPSDIKAVHEQRMQLKTARVAITKKGKEMRDDANKFAKAVIAKEKELIGIIEPEELRLKEVEDAEKQRKEREDRLAILPTRKDRLAAIGDQVEVTDDELLDMDAEQFEVYYNRRLADKNEAERAALEEQKRQQEEEQRKLDAEKEAREREERARQEERERAEREAKEREERAAREAEEAKQRKIADRKNKLTSLGLEPADEHVNLDDEAFGALVAKREAEIAREREEEARAQEEAARKEDERYQNWLAEIGYNEDTQDEFYFSHSTAGHIVAYRTVGSYKK